MGELEQLVLLEVNQKELKEVQLAINQVSSFVDSSNDESSLEEITSIIEQSLDTVSFEGPTYQISLSYDKKETPSYVQFEYEKRQNVDAENGEVAYQAQTEQHEKIIDEGSELGYDMATQRKQGDVGHSFDDKQQDQVEFAKLSMSQIEWFMVCEGILIKGVYRMRVS